MLPTGSELCQNIQSTDLASEMPTSTSLTTTTRRIIKKIIYINGQPVMTEEPCDVSEKALSEHLIRKQLVKRVIYINGEPVETEEEIEEPVSVQAEEVSCSEGNPKELSVVSIGTQSSSTKITQERPIRKMLFINGEPVEILEGVQNLGSDQHQIQDTSDISEGSTSLKTITKRVTRKIIYVNGQPVETEEFENHPSEQKVTTVRVTNPENTIMRNVENPVTTTTLKTLKRKKVKTITYINGEPFEMEEEVEDPVAEISEGVPDDRSSDNEMYHRSGTPTSSKTLTKRIITRTIYVDGKPIGTEEIEIPTEMEETVSSQYVLEQPTLEPTKVKCVVKQIAYDGNPIEAEDVDDSTKVNPETPPSVENVQQQSMKTIVYINGKPYQTNEVYESTPEEQMRKVASELSFPSSRITTYEKPETTTIVRTIRRKKIKTITYINGEPVETEEEIEEPEVETVVEKDSEVIPHHELNKDLSSSVTTFIKRIIKRITYVDGKPVETEEEVIVPSDVDDQSDSTYTPIVGSIEGESKKMVVYINDEPVETTEELEGLPEEIKLQIASSSGPENMQITEIHEKPETTTVFRTIRRKKIKTITYINGEPVETEEEIEEPEVETVVEKDSEVIPHDELNKDLSSSVTTFIKRIIKQITYVDGKPVETEEVIVPSEVDNQSDSTYTPIVGSIEGEPKKMMVYINDKPVETTEELEGLPEEIKLQIASSSGPENMQITEIHEKPETTTIVRTIRRKKIKTITYINGEPVETEEEIEEPEVETVVEKDSEVIPHDELNKDLSSSVTTFIKRIIKRITYVDGKPVETEEEVIVPSDVDDQSDSTYTPIVGSIEGESKKMVVSINDKPLETTEELEGLPEEIKLQIASSSGPENMQITKIYEKPETTTIVRTIRRKKIKTITYINGEPVETEEEIEEPEVETVVEKDSEVIPHDELNKDLSSSVTTFIKRIIKRITYVDGKPVETEEEVIVPSDVDDQSDSTYTPIVGSIEGESKKMVVYINDKPVETTEELEGLPEEIKLQIASNSAPENIRISEIHEEPETTTIVRTIKRKKIKTITYINGEPVETEEEIEEPEVETVVEKDYEVIPLLRNLKVYQKK